MTGKQLFEINAGKGKMNNMNDLSSALENMNCNNVTCSHEEEEKKKSEDEENKKNIKQKERLTNTIHNQFMILLLDVLTDFTNYVKHSIIDAIVDEVMADKNLKTKWTLTDFKEKVFSIIFDRINNQLFCSADENNKNLQNEDSDTDYDSDSDSSSFKKANDSLQADELDKFKETNLKKFKSMIISKLSQSFANVNPEKYVNGVKEEIAKKVDQSLPVEFEDPNNLFKHTIDTMCDYLETSYCQSIFVESIDMAYILYMEQFSKDFEIDFGVNDPVFLAKIIPLIFRMREFFKQPNVVLKDLEENKKDEEDKNKEEEKEEPKVVELTEEELQSSSNNILNNQNLNEEHNEESKKLDDDHNNQQNCPNENNSKLEDLRQSIKLFAKLILTEGIENSPDIDVPFGFGGEDMGELGPILQSIMG